MDGLGDALHVEDVADLADAGRHDAVILKDIHRGQGRGGDGIVAAIPADALEFVFVLATN